MTGVKRAGAASRRVEQADTKQIIASHIRQVFRRVMSTAAELAKLPVAERLALIDELWTSISEAEVAASESQMKGAQSRLSELKANPSLGLTYEQLKARLADVR